MHTTQKKKDEENLGPNQGDQLFCFELKVKKNEVQSWCKHFKQQLNWPQQPNNNN